MSTHTCEETNRNFNKARRVVSDRSRTTGSVSEAMLERAMKVAVTEGVFPRMVDMQTGVKNWLALRACLEAAITE